MYTGLFTIKGLAASGQIFYPKTMEFSNGVPNFVCTNPSKTHSGFNMDSMLIQRHNVDFILFHSDIRHFKKDAKSTSG